MKLPKGRVRVLRTKEGRFRVTLPRALAEAVGLRGGETGRFRLLEFREDRVVLALVIEKERDKP